MMLTLPRFTGIVAVVLMLATSAIQAATVTFSTTLPLTSVANPAAGAVSGASAVFDQNVTGSFVSQRISPWDATNSSVSVATGPYSSIRSTSASVASVDFNFSSVMKELSYVWGTPGSTNQIEFFLGGISQFVFFGNTLFSGNSAQGLSIGGSLSVLTTFTGLSFDNVVFSAGKPAFEFANLTAVAAVPVPAAGLMLLGALAGLAALRRRKQAV